MNINERLRHHTYKIDVRNNTEKIEMELEQLRPEFIFHLAALSSAPLCTMSPKDAVAVNVVGFQNFLEASYYYKVKRIVYASTSSMYNGHQLPFNENMCIMPKTVYEATFHDRESLAFAYSNEFGVSSVGLRFFSIYGPNERHKKKYANNITQFMWDLMGDRRPIIFDDGKQTRDFIYVDDVVEALKLAAFSDHSLLKCNIVNVGTGVSTSFNEIINKLNKKLGKDIKPEYRSNPHGGNYVRHTKADTTKAQHLLRFTPKISLDEGIDKLIQSYG